MAGLIDLAEMLKNPPDPNGPIPVSNRPATMYGATIPFHILSWITVLTRLYTRFKVVRDPGWDDYFVILAAILNLVSNVAFLGGVHNGFGKHLIYLEEGQFEPLKKYLYVQTASYITVAAVIKISLLCQYRRLFRTGLIHVVCVILLVAVSLWGIPSSFMAWFPCFPVSAYWNRTTNSRCYAFGFGAGTSGTVAILSFVGFNTFFDVVIFLVPMAEVFKHGQNRKQILLLSGLMALGSIVILMSVLRLSWSLAKNNAPSAESMDFTWWYPLTLIFTCLEVDFAIICASIPIFWPTMVASLSQIFVTKEVRVSHHQRLDVGMDYEMDRRSLKSMNSQEGLTREAGQQKTNYQDPFVVEHVLGKTPVNTEVEARMVPPKAKWWSPER